MKAIEGCDDDYNTSFQCLRKRKLHPDENKEGKVILTESEKCRLKTLYVIIDRLKAELRIIIVIIITDLGRKKCSW